MNAPADAVWHALTDAQELTRWFPPEARVRPGEGGSIFMSWGNEYQFAAPIDVWKPCEQLRLLYYDPNVDGDVTERAESERIEVPSRIAESPAVSRRQTESERIEIPSRIAVSFYLSSEGGGTTLRVVQTGFSTDAAWDEQYDATVRGWRFQLALLKHYLERHRGEDRLLASARVLLKSETRELAWNRLFSSDGPFTGETLQNLAAGSACTLRSGIGQSPSGRILTCNPPTEFIACIENLNDAVLRISFDDLWDTRDVWMLLNAYGVPKAIVESLRDEWISLLRRLYPTAIAG